MKPYKIKLNGVFEKVRLTIVVNGYIELDIKTNGSRAFEIYQQYLDNHPELTESENDQDIQVSLTAYKL